MSHLWTVPGTRANDFTMSATSIDRIITMENDIEPGDPFFGNTLIKRFGWDNITVQVKDRKQGLKTILTNNSGCVSAGQVLALMGPSGSGKSTLLNVLADRSQASFSGIVTINDTKTTNSVIRSYSSYVEQNDTQIGGLTVEESLDFAARLASPCTSSTVRRARNLKVLIALGLMQQRNSTVSPILKAGISGGQRRRLGLGTALVTGPKILFLDEPTSGLDSAASHQIIGFLTKLAKRYGLINTSAFNSTFDLFDLVALISNGQMCYHGPRNRISNYFRAIIPDPGFKDSADYLLDLVNTDFEYDAERHMLITKTLCQWQKYAMTTKPAEYRHDTLPLRENRKQSWNAIYQFRICWILLHRNFIKSYRDPLVYGTRLLMNTALSIIVGTVWWRLSYDQMSLQTFINCIFFSSAFMAMMVVAYAPPAISDIRMLQKEHASGLYGAFAFTIANFLIGLPWLFLVAMAFSTIVYLFSNLYLTLQGFAMFTMWLYLDLLSSESLMMIISGLTPQFVTALAIVSSVNGLWLSIDGSLIPVEQLSAFWKYAFHYIDFQTYVFQGMMVNQFKDTSYDCEPLSNGTYHCIYLSNLAPQSKINGTAVLEAYGYPLEPRKSFEWIGYVIAIIIVQRFIGTLVLQWRAGRK